MGFDLYGENPKNNAMEDDLNRRDALGKKWSDGSLTEEQEEEYFALTKAIRADNPGEYFRNNVWWWRKLWIFVCNSCDKILSEKDISGGSFNDNHLITEDKALAIADRLDALLEDGTVDTIQKDVMEQVEAGRKINKQVEKEIQELRKLVIKATGNEDIVPMNYPEEWREQYDKIRSKENWSSRYPFHKDNVKEFSKFCRQSGGFRIC
tara:strand:- start:822 stop:1445 length:624 start_codon:yes stop_codon:yes gene_type:complete